MVALPTQRGFSLIELAVVLVIIGLLVGGGIAAISATTEQTRRSEQKRIFNDAREALYGFAMGEGHLPCPDDYEGDDDGAEDRDGSGSCELDEGQLPWADLGVGRRDAWGNPILYRVDGHFADDSGSGTASFALGDTGALSVQDGTTSPIVPIVQDAPAVLVSFGPQGNQVWASGTFVCPGNGGSTPASGFSSDETENCDDDNTFVEAGYRTAESGDRFDDMLMWIPTSVLESRMVQAGKLP